VCRLYTAKEEASSPMVSLEAMKVSCAIDTKESRYGIVTDILGAFMQTWRE